MRAEFDPSVAVPLGDGQVGYPPVSARGAPSLEFADPIEQYDREGQVRRHAGMGRGL